MNATAPRHTARYRQRMHSSLMALSAVAVAALLAGLAARPLPVEAGTGFTGAVVTYTSHIPIL